MENKKCENSQEVAEAPSDIDESGIQREIVHEEVGAFMMQSGFPGMEISNKITPEHINQMLATEDKKVDIALKDRHEDRIFKFAIIFIAVIVIFALCLFFKDDIESLQKIIAPIISLIIGAVGGYGYGKTKKDNSDD